MAKHHRCEFLGCHKTGTIKLRNGHYVCEDCFKKIKHNKKVFKHNVFLKEVLIFTFPKTKDDKTSTGVCSYKYVKF